MLLHLLVKAKEFPKVCWQRAGKGSCVISLPETGHATLGEKAFGSGRVVHGDGSNRSLLQTSGARCGLLCLHEGQSAAQARPGLQQGENPNKHTKGIKCTIKN